jgi:hypothetical protein
MTENTMPEIIFNDYLKTVKDEKKIEELKKLKTDILYLREFSYYNLEIEREITKIRKLIISSRKKDLEEFEKLMKARDLSAFKILQKWENNNSGEKNHMEKFVEKCEEIFNSFLKNIKTKEEWEENKKFFTTIFENDKISKFIYNCIDEQLIEILKEITSKQNNEELKITKNEKTDITTNQNNDKELKITENEEKQSPTNIVLLIFVLILAVAGIVLGYLFIIYLGVCSVTVFWQISHEIKQTNSSLSLKIGRTILYFFAGPYNIIRYKRIYGTYNLFS